MGDDENNPAVPVPSFDADDPSTWPDKPAPSWPRHVSEEDAARHSYVRGAEGCKVTISVNRENGYLGDVGNQVWFGATYILGDEDDLTRVQLLAKSALERARERWR